jgi:hypothetical protein
MPQFNDLNKMLKYLQQDVLDSMSKDVADKVKEVEQKHVQDDVFDAYPGQHSYQRRSSYGLDDPNNMIEDFKIVGDQVILTVSNMTRGKDETDRYIADLVEYGDSSVNPNQGQGIYQYQYNGSQYTYMNPRPFLERTIEDLEKNQQHKETLKNSLKRKGYDVK